jgi:eukaryotic-like serine/threonine-protein kinase
LLGGGLRLRDRPPLSAPLPRTGGGPILTNATAITDPRIGAIVQGRYRILSRLAAGGMGVVYQAERIELGRTVAIKFLHPWIAADQAFKRRFETEAKAMSRLAHPCCVSVIDFGEEDGSPFLVMDFVAGETLRELSRQGPMPPRRAIAIARQMLAGLAHAHEQGITHRDVKPENVVVTQVVGLGDQVRILDFGVAKLRDSAANITRGMIVGTPAYMGPEQIRSGTVDARTDLYATAVVLFELLTGHRPFEAAESSDILRMHLREKPPTLNAKLPSGGFSAELETVLARALEKSLNGRFQAATDFAGALAQTPEGAALRSEPFSSPAATSVLPEQAPTTSSSEPFSSPAATSVLPEQAPTTSSSEPRGPDFSLVGPARRAEIPRAVSVPPRSMGRSWRMRALGRLTRALVSMPRRRIAWAVVALLVLAAGAVAPLMASAGAWGWRRAASVESRRAASVESRRAASVESTPQASPAPAATIEPKGSEEVAGLAEAWRLAEAGRRDSALVALSRLRREHPENARVAFVQAQVNFRNYRWLDGLDSYRAAINLDPSYRRDEKLIVDLIRCLDSDRFQSACADFLYSEIGADALPQLEEAAQSHPLRNVRYRAARLSRRLSGTDLSAP